MRRREFIALFGASVAWPFAAMAQQAGRDLIVISPASAASRARSGTICSCLLLPSLR